MKRCCKKNIKIYLLSTLYNRLQNKTKLSIKKFLAKKFQASGSTTRSLHLKQEAVFLSKLAFLDLISMTCQLWGTVFLDL